MTDPNNESEDELTLISESNASVSDTDNEKTKDTEKQLIYQLLSENPLNEGEMYFVLPYQWWANWKDYVCYDYSSPWRSTNIPPGPVDNTILLELDKETLRRSVNVHYDVHTVPKPVWEKFIQWYGGGPAITRKCIRDRHSLSVEIRDMEFWVILSSKMTIPERVSFSKATTIGEFRDEMQKRLGFIPEKVRIWDFMRGKKECELRDMSKTLSDMEITDKQYVLIEEKKKNGLWPSNRRYYKFQLTQHYRDSPAEPGQTGMENFGNICFMISALQCLSNIVPLTDYFLSGSFNEAINENNPLGMKGEIAKEYANLLKELWSSNTSIVDPQKMKRVIEKFAPRFAGYLQHDAQELLAFFLDGVHEDLNRITCKPDVPNIEGGEQDDARIAAESWKNYKLRNDSIIVNNFQGLLKSTLVCPVNGRVSVTFDPFMYLSIPLPVGATRRIPVRVHFLEKNSQEYEVEIDKFGSIMNFKWELSKLCEIEAERLVVCEINFSNFQQIFEDDSSVSTIRKLDDIHVYEILCDPKPNPKEHASNNQSDINNPTPGQDITNNQTNGESNGETGVNINDNSSDHTNNNKKEDSHLPLSTEINLDYVHIFIVHALASYSHIYAGDYFGTPLIESIPRYITYRQLYTHLISRLSLVLKKIPDTNISLEAEEKRSSDDFYHNDYLRYKQTIRFGAIFEIISTDKFGLLSDDFKNDDFPLKLYDGQRVLLKWSEKTKSEYYNLEKEKKEKKIENTKNEKTITLYDCLDLFTSEEILAPENKWYCSECKEFQQATKKFDLWSAPSILVIHLKRFLCKPSDTIHGMFREKLSHHVIFPLTDLDLTKYVIGPIEFPPIYDLVALSNHHGTVNVGHYITFALHRNNKNWYSFDDGRVTSLSSPYTSLEQSIITPSAYVLFYKRKDVNWPPLDPSWERENCSESSGGEEDTVGVVEDAVEDLIDGGENGGYGEDGRYEEDGGYDDGRYGEDGEDGEDGDSERWARRSSCGRNCSDPEMEEIVFDNKTDEDCG